MQPNLQPDLPQMERDLQNLETAIAELKARYQQVQTDEALRDQLQEQRQALQTQSLQEASPETQSTLQTELKMLTEQLDAIELRLESRLLNWLGMRQYFWQIVRFTGLGLVLGWGLHSLTIEPRTPQNPAQGAILERQP